MADATRTMHHLDDAAARAADAASTVREQVGEKASQVKTRLSGMAQSATDAVNSGRLSTANRLDNAASYMHEQTERIRTAGHHAADRVSSTAAYVRSHDARDVAGDLQSMIRTYPGPAILAAAALGFLMGRALSRR
jgi:ElaB/YqjD/DUF883 family membrane-anchored ribosome-binding protein